MATKDSIYVENPLFAIDFYKTGHIRQYPKGTTKVYANLTPRSNRLYKGKYDKVVVFGFQMFIRDYLLQFIPGFFQRELEEVISEYKEFMDSTLGHDAISVEHITALHKLGYLPIEIKALPEGTRCPIKVPVATITNTHPDFYWLPNYLETVLSTELWKPMTNATIALEYRHIFEKYAKATGGDEAFILFQGHDFSARGLSNREDGYKAQMGHLLSFYGTDTVMAIRGAKRFYDADYTKELVGTSVPATEHSVMCMGGKEGELETFRRLITELYPSGIVSIVSDTWDFWNTITVIASTLKDEILNRTPNALGLAKVVFRPDSGNPVDILCGYIELKSLDVAENGWTNTHCYEVPTDSYVFKKDGKYFKVFFINDSSDYICELYIEDGFEVPEAEAKGAVECLWEIFGGTTNDKGFRTLNQRVGLIYGDSITLERAEQILERLKNKNFASDNVVFGIGSYTYQYNTRDTFGFAMKATYGVVHNKGVEIFKDPITDSGTKKSAKGLLKVVRVEGKLALLDQQTVDSEDSEDNELKTIYKNGNIIVHTTLQEIRDRLHS